MCPNPQRRRYLVTGGNGFIGSHVAKRLYERGDYVRIVDVAPKSSFPGDIPICSDLLVGDISDSALCARAVEDIDVVLHFAATMGGMGTIHPANDFVIYEQNSRMTLTILSASLSVGVKQFFYASTACVYPESLQGSDQKDVSLRETDVWSNPPPMPQGLYGLEKLASEMLLRQTESKIDVCIARFHNVYGPRGAWANGREKAPAAFARKACAALLDHSGVPLTIEVWGNGRQRRSFLYIEDAVAAVLRLLEPEHRGIGPVNIGSDISITVDELAKLACKCAGLDANKCLFQYDGTKPVGVSSRNSNNTYVRRTLGWSPKTSLEKGMSDTVIWVRGEMEKTIEGMVAAQRSSILQDLKKSQLVDLHSGDIAFAILLPITSWICFSKRLYSKSGQLRELAIEDDLSRHARDAFRRRSISS